MVMKIKILKEIYVKRPCKKKSKNEKGNCAVLDPSTKKQTSCYDDCDTARKAKHATNEEQLEEISSMAAGDVSGAGRGTPFGNRDELLKDNEREKERSRLKEMFSTSTQTGGVRISIVSAEKEYTGHAERSKHQGLRNVMRETEEETYPLSDIDLEDLKVAVGGDGTEPPKGGGGDGYAGQSTAWKLIDFADSPRNASRVFDVLNDVEKNIGFEKLEAAIMLDNSAKNRLEVMSKKFGYDRNLYERIENGDEEAIRKYYQFLINEFLFWIAYNPMSSAQQYAGRMAMLSKPTKDLAYAHIHLYVSDPNKNNPRARGKNVSQQAEFYKLTKDLDPALYDLPEE